MTAVPPAGGRGPQRPRSADAEIQALLDAVLELNERLRSIAIEQGDLVKRRRGLIARLHAAGLSVRAIASTMGVATATVQTALRAAEAIDDDPAGDARTPRP